MRLLTLGAGLVFVLAGTCVSFGAICHGTGTHTETGFSSKRSLLVARSVIGGTPISTSYSLEATAKSTGNIGIVRITSPIPTTPSAVTFTATITSTFPATGAPLVGTITGNEAIVGEAYADSTTFPMSLTCEPGPVYRGDAEYKCFFLQKTSFIDRYTESDYNYSEYHTSIIPEQAACGYSSSIFTATDVRRGTVNSKIQWTPKFGAPRPAGAGIKRVFVSRRSSNTFKCFLEPIGVNESPTTVEGDISDVPSIMFGFSAPSKDNDGTGRGASRFIVVDDNSASGVSVLGAEGVEEFVDVGGEPSIRWVQTSLLDEEGSLSTYEGYRTVILNGDVDSDGAVSRSDRLALAARIGHTISGPEYFPEADLVPDGSIDLRDWLRLGYNPDVFTCIADIASEPQNLGPDGQLTTADIIVFYNRFFAGDLIADIAMAAQVPGHDGEHTADDIIVFFNRFFAGCD
jgi:hypothetical protein